MRETEELEKLVSIAIPTLNRSKSLQHAIESSLKQSYQNIEVLILDNFSTDETATMLGSIEDQRVKIFKSEKRLPVSENWQRCIDFATGRYMLVLSDDDILYSNAVETLIKPFLTGIPQRELPASKISLSIGRSHMLYSDSALISGASQETYLDGRQFIVNSLKGRSAFYPSASLFRVADARKVGGFLHNNIDSACDVLLAARLAKLSGVAFTEKHVAIYHIHSQNLTKNLNVKKIIRETEGYADYCLQTITDQISKNKRRDFKFLIFNFKARRIFSLIKKSDIDILRKVNSLFKVKHYVRTYISFLFFLTAILYSVFPKKIMHSLLIIRNKLRS